VWGFFVVFLVNDSEYSQSARQYSTRPHSGIYLISPGALLLHAPPPHPAPPFWGEGSTKKKKENRLWRWHWRLDMFASAWVAPPNPGGKPPGMVGSIRVYFAHLVRFCRWFAVAPFFGGGEKKMKKIRKSSPKGPDRFSPPWM
jgi:hypothetical protein